MLLENGIPRKVETRKNLRGWVTLEAWEIDGVRHEIRYTYDDAGNRTSMTYPDGTTVRFEYNERNQLVRIPGFFEGPMAGAWADNAGFRYDANGFLIGLRSANGIETTFQPDQRNRLAQISSPPLTLTYAYTPGGNVASITDASNAEPFTLAFGYDGLNRLTSAQVHMPTGIETVQYVYDGLGNRIKEAWTDARGAIGYAYLPGNYLVQRGATTYSWGAYGQLTLKDEQPGVSGGETHYDYSARRLLTQVRVNGSPAAQFVYDPYGRRVKTVEGDTTTLTLYSGNDIVYEVRTQAGQGPVTTKYLAVNGKYLAKVVQEGTNLSQTYFYHTDLVGSVRAITDSQGQVVARFEYEPFGVTVQASGSLAGSEVHKFTGKPEDAAVGLYYYYARCYSPEVGRFLSRDPIDGSYVYVHNAPLILVDPVGLQAKAEWQAFVNKQPADIRELLVANRVTFRVYERSSLIKSLIDPPLLAKIPWEVASTGLGFAESAEETTRLLVRLGVPEKVAKPAAGAITFIDPVRKAIDRVAEAVADRWDPTESCSYRMIHISRQEREGVISYNVTDMFALQLGDGWRIDVRHYSGTVYDLTGGPPSLILYIAALREPTRPSRWSWLLRYLGDTDGLNRRVRLRIE